MTFRARCSASPSCAACATPRPAPPRSSPRISSRGSRPISSPGRNAVIIPAPALIGRDDVEKMVALKSADIEKFVARPDAARPVVLIFGADAGLVRERAEKIIKASVDDPDDPFSLVRLEGDDLSGDAGRLVDEANTIPLFGGRRAVWVKAGGRNIAPAVEALLASPPKDCRVVIEAGDLRRGAPLRNVCERAKSAAAIPCYPDGEREIARLIDEEMQSASLSIAPDARAALTPLLGGD